VTEAEPVALIKEEADPESNDVKVPVTEYEAVALLDAVGEIVVEEDGLVVVVEKLEDETVTEADPVALIKEEADPESYDVIVPVTVYESVALLDAVGEIVVDDDGLVVVVEKLEDETVTEAEPVMLVEAETEPESDDVIVLETTPDADELLDALGEIVVNEDELGVVVE
jgi:hypothetical protein